MAKDSQTRFVSSKAWDRIEQWSRRKPIFALMGEFSAGKSTLMNFLLRSDALPTQVTATQLPPVWFSWGKQTPYVLRADGSREDITLDQLDAVGVNDAQFVRIFLETDILEAVDLIDTPGISDPKISSDVWRRAVGQANGVLWCTHATQAWRETERATWVSLPERLQHNSLLLVTRADVLAPKDRQKVLRRVNREAGHLFNRSILFSARDAITARDKNGDAELWARSGGGKMVDSFLEITEQIMDDRAEQLARYQIDSSITPAQITQPRRPVTTEDRPAPLKLVDPITEPSGAEDDALAVASLPVRPARVELRADDIERAPRIDPQEAERLRAEMTGVQETPFALEEIHEQEEELRAFFKEAPNSELGLSELPLVDVDEFNLVGDNSTQPLEDPNLSSEQDVTENTHVDFITSLEDKLAETPEQPEPAPIVDQNPAAETSVASITALMAEQSTATDEEFEPEPENNGLIDIQLAPAPCANSESKPLEELLAVPADTPLSAAAMWREVTSDEDMPEDADTLKQMFLAFLEEFDQISAEHHAQGSDKSASSMPQAAKNTNAEWHVL